MRRPAAQYASACLLQADRRVDQRWMSLHYGASETAVTVQLQVYTPATAYAHW
jgi:hypothetical protein